MLIRNTLGLILLVAGSACGAEPLVWFDFEDGLKNRGTLGGTGQFTTYAPGEEATFDTGPLGRCLDLTAASRHGGTGSERGKAGGGVRFRHAALDALQTFTLTIWHRQNPLAKGPNARLLTKENAWDLLPQPDGASLGLGPASQKISYSLSGKHRERPADGWRFTAVVVEAEKLRAYTGGLGLALLPCGEQPRQQRAAAGAGDLVLGTLGGIRPFNGWLDQVRIFGEPLDEPTLRAVYEADCATANTTPPTPFYARTRPSAGAHRFHLKRSDIPFSVRWQTRSEAPAVMQSFHATQCLWVYGTDPAVIQRIRRLGIGYQGTLNGLQGTEQSTPGLSAQGDLTGRHENLDGQKNMPSWMVTFKPPHYTGCCNHPAFRDLFFQAARQLVDIPRSTARTRAALATTYALGQTHLVPWDLYMGSDATGSQPRYFGTREQYGDLYDFIHDHAGLLDDHESAAEIAVLTNADAPDKESLPQFCQRLAAQQLPFHLVLSASRFARVPVRAADLQAVRLVVEFSPLESFYEEDQRVIQQVRKSGATRFVRANADLAAICRVRGLTRLRVEGPEGIYAFPRVDGARRSATIHLVNWNLGRDGQHGELYRNVTLSLLAPPHWGPVAAAVYHQPGQPAVPLEPEVHDDSIRLTLPQIGTWGIVEIRAATR